MGYWETLFDPRFMFDNEWKQRRDLIETEAMVSVAQEQGSQALAGVNVLQRQVGMLQAQVHDLSVTVMALVEMLASANQVDPSELRTRVEAAIEGERAAARAVADAAAAEREQRRLAESRATSQGVTAPITCIRCKTTVPANQTTMTGDGPVCDNCAR